MEQKQHIFGHSHRKKLWNEGEVLENLFIFTTIRCLCFHPPSNAIHTQPDDGYEQSDHPHSNLKMWKLHSKRVLNGHTHTFPH